MQENGHAPIATLALTAAIASAQLRGLGCGGSLERDSAEVKAVLASLFKRMDAEGAAASHGPTAADIKRCGDVALLEGGGETPSLPLASIKRIMKRDALTIVRTINAEVGHQLPHRYGRYIRYVRYAPSTRRWGISCHNARRPTSPDTPRHAPDPVCPAPLLSRVPLRRLVVATVPPPPPPV